MVCMAAVLVVQVVVPQQLHARGRLVLLGGRLRSRRPAHEKVGPGGARHAHVVVPVIPTQDWAPTRVTLAHLGGHERGRGSRV